MSETLKKNYCATTYQSTPVLVAYRKEEQRKEAACTSTSKLFFWAILHEHLREGGAIMGTYKYTNAILKWTWTCTQILNHL